MKLLIPFFCVSVAAWTATPQARIGAPAAGFVFDPMVRGIRPVMGAPGAAVAGDPLDAGLSLDTAVVSPGQDFAMIVGSEDRAVRVLSLRGDFESPILGQAVNAPTRIVFSPSGSSVGLYALDSAKLQVFSQLPDHPSLVREIGVSGLTGDLLSAAISDDGDLVLFVTGDRDNPAAWLSSYGSDPVQLPFSAAAMSFLASSHDVAMAMLDGKVLLARNIDTASDYQALSAAEERIKNPVAVQFSTDGIRVYVASQQGAVASIDTHTGAATFGSCACTPSGLSPFYSGRLLRLNDFSDGPVMLLDAVNPGLHVWFVPGIVRSEESAQ